LAGLKVPTTLATDRCSVIAITAGNGTPCLPASVMKSDRRLWPPIIAVGVNTDGRREVLGLEVDASEAEPF
jgi:hypothetical protein